MNSNCFHYNRNPCKAAICHHSGNFVSYSNPSASPSLQAMNLGANFAASEEYVSTVGTFSTNGNLDQTAAYLWAGVGGGGFIDPGTFAPPTGVNVAGLSAVIVNVASDTVCIVPAPITQ